MDKSPPFAPKTHSREQATADALENPAHGECIPGKLTNGARPRTNDRDVIAFVGIPFGANATGRVESRIQFDPVMIRVAPRLAMMIEVDMHGCPNSRRGIRIASR